MKKSIALFILLSVLLYSCSGKKEVQPALAGFTTEQTLPFDNGYYRVEALEEFSPWHDSLLIAPWIKYCTYEMRNNPSNSIGDIFKGDIIRHGKKGQTEAIFFTKPITYAQTLWIGMTHDAGQHWEYYFTGLIQGKPLFTKWFSEMPMILSDSILQIEAAAMHFSWDWNDFGYKIDKDGLLLTFNLNALKKDSDKDGLSDLEELFLQTNPQKPDTDGDGIPDGEDMNPRFKRKDSDVTRLYEAYLNNEFYEDSCFIPIKSPSAHSTSFTNATETKFIISNDKYLQHAEPDSCRLIILTEEEHLANESLYDESMFSFSMSITEKEKNAFHLNCNDYHWSMEADIKKTKQGWLFDLEYVLMDD